MSLVAEPKDWTRVSNSWQVLHRLMASAMAFDFAKAMVNAESVKMTTPALPSELAIARYAAACAVSWAGVVTFTNTLGASIGPGAVPACQPTTVIPWALA